MESAEPRRVYAVDADDTLWPTGGLYENLAGAVRAALDAAFGAGASGAYETVLASRRAAYGYGALAFGATLTRTAAEAAGGQPLPAEVVKLIADGCDGIHEASATPLPGVAEALATLRESGRVIVVTKGSAIEQGRKLARSGLAGLCDGLCVLPDKTDGSWHRFLTACGAPVALVVGVGDDYDGDVAPLLRLGASAYWLAPADAPDPQPGTLRATGLAEFAALAASGSIAESLRGEPAPLLLPPVQADTAQHTDEPRPAPARQAVSADPDPLASHPAVSVPEARPEPPAPVVELPAAEWVDADGTPVLAVHADAQVNDVVQARISAEDRICHALIYHATGDGLCYGVECDAAGMPTAA